ncbi:MAG: tetratricopeptide repeat protein [Deltaproteobacteria bacterium]|nr:tetratricopeptide repeat protein [Deltaproteobacteria bacterium]
MKDVYPYTPRKTAHENLERYFVARHELLNELLDNLKSQAKSKSRQHWMILGPRGLGKSHLVALLHHRIKRSSYLNGKWIPILMDEEEPEVFSLATLLARITSVMAEELRTDQPEQAMEVLDFLDGLRKDTPSPEDLYEELVAFLKDFTNKNKKRIVVFLENTDDLFTNSLKSDKEIKTFRNLLLHEDFILFIATSPTFFKRIEKQKEPLYGVFRLRRLELLDFEQSMDLMRRWADAARNGDMQARLKRPDFRLRVLHHLTGGNPRLLLFLYLTLSGQKEMESATVAFGKLLEHDLTGFYLSRMKDVPEQQKPIIVSLAKSRTNLTQKEIAERTFLPISSMGTHINRLESSGLVRAFTKKAGKNTLYGLTDHLFRLWHQWRSGWREREVIQALIEFLAIWYRKRELASLAKGKGTYALYARQALEFRLEEDFQSRLELVRKEAMADFRKHLLKGDYQGVFHLVESLSDFDLDQKPLIEELEKKLFHNGPEKWSEALLVKWENKLIKDGEERQDIKAVRPMLGRIRRLQALASISKGRPLSQIPMKELEHGELASLIGDFKLKENDFSGAEEAFRRTVEIDPDNDKAWKGLGLARFKQDNYLGAEEAFERTVELNPNNSMAWWSGLGLTRLKQGNFSGAEKALKRAVELDPNSAVDWRLLGLTRLNQDEYSGAEKAYKRALGLDPNDAEAWDNLGFTRGNQGNHSGAEEAFQQVVKLEPKNANAWNNLGVARLHQNNYPAAEEALRCAVELDQDNDRVWTALGLARFGQDDYSGAEEAFQRVVKLDSNNIEEWRFLGTVRLHQDNYPGAEEAYKQAVKLEPDDAKNWLNIGLACLKQDNHSGAEEAFQRVIAIDKEMAVAWFGLGIACRYQWKLKQSHKAVLMGLELDPQYIEPYTGLVEIHIVSQGRLDALKRLDMSLQLKQIAPHLRAALHLLRALVLAREENKPAALQAMRNGHKWFEKLDPDTQAEQRQSVLSTIMDPLRDIILPETWKVAHNYLKIMAQAAPGVHEVIGRLEHVVEYFKELEFEPEEKSVTRNKAAARAQRVLDRLPTEERGPIEEAVKEVEKNIKRWQAARDQKWD